MALYFTTQDQNPKQTAKTPAPTTMAQ